MSQVALEPCNCGVCGAASWHDFLPGCKDWLFSVPGSYDFVQCDDCGHVYLNPRPSEESRALCYPSGYYTHLPTTRPRIVELIRHTLETVALLPYRLRYGGAWAPVRPFGNRRALDVGCGNGKLLKRLRQMGWDVKGIEMDPDAAKLAREALGTERVVNGDLADTSFVGEKFDLILIIHTLEHLPRPRSVLGQVQRLLAPGGQVIVAVPDILSAESRLFGRFWQPLETTRHLQMFSRHSLAFLLSSCGFQIIAMRPSLQASSLVESAWIALVRSPGMLPPHILSAVAIAAMFPVTVLLGAVGLAGSIELRAIKQA